MKLDFRLVFYALTSIGLMFSVFAGEPQQKLPVSKLQIGSAEIAAEVADEPKEREIGMMFRTEMGENDGMLFVMESPSRAAFWMKNTLIPLSIAYISSSGLILEIHEMLPKDETPVPSRFTTIAYALEMPGGWFSRRNIKPGAKIEGLPPLPL